MTLNNSHAPIHGRNVDSMIRKAHEERARAIRTAFSGLFGADQTKGRVVHG